MFKKLLMATAIFTSTAFAADNVVLGNIAIGQSTQDEVEQILADKNCSFNSVTDMITTDANCYNLPNLQSVTFGF